MLPCSKHGDPRILSPRLSAWLEFFNVIAPYSTAQTLDHQLISKICDDYDIPFTRAFEKLTFILNICTEGKKNVPPINSNEDKRVWPGTNPMERL